MTDARTRRAFLGLVGVGAAAGCSGVPSFTGRPPPVSADPQTDWLQAGRDAGHAAYSASAGAVPSEIRWELGPHEYVSRPVVVGESVYVTAKVQERGLFGHPKEEAKVALLRIDASDGTAARVAVTDDGFNRWSTADLSFHRGRFYLASNASLFALDARTGREAWRRGDVSTVVRPAAANGQVVVGCRDGVCCFDAGTGDRRWRNAIPARRTIIDSPAIADGRVVYAEHDGNSTEPPQSATVRVVEADTGTVTWSMETNVVSYGRPVVAGDTAYLGNEEYVYALDAATGERRWRTPISRPEHWLGTDLCVGPERVFVAENPDDGRGLAALSRDDGERVWTLNARGYCYRATRTKDVLYLCVAGERNRNVAEDFHASVLSLDPASGERYWKYRLRGYSADPPVAAGDSLYVTRGLRGEMSLLAFGY